MNDENRISIELQEIYDEVQSMEYTEDNFLDLMNYLDKVVELIEPINTNERYNGFLSQLH